jgi:hypothetical protein
MKNDENIVKKELSNDVLINRKILGWEWYKDVNTYKLFTHLIYKANYEDKLHRGVLVKRGQIYTGLDKLKFETGLSVTNIRTSIKRLLLTDNITSKSTNKYRIITVLKYNTYQLANNQTDKQNEQSSTSQLTASNKDKELLKEIKQLKKVIKDMTKKEKTFPSIIYRKFKHLSLTQEEFERLLKDGFNKVEIDNKLDDIENYSKNKSYTSLNLTVRKWLKKDEKQIVQSTSDDKPLDYYLGIGEYEKES